MRNPLLFEFFQVIDVVLFEGLKEFEKYLARDQAEDWNLDHILTMLPLYEAFSTEPTSRRF
jgi:hypothetical protein